MEWLIEYTRNLIIERWNDVQTLGLKIINTILELTDKITNMIRK